MFKESLMYLQDVVSVYLGTSWIFPHLVVSIGPMQKWLSALLTSFLS